jgi:hypothetical protein
MGTTRRHVRLSMSVTTIAEVSCVRHLSLASVVQLSIYSIAVLQLARCEHLGCEGTYQTRPRCTRVAVQLAPVITLERSSVSVDHSITAVPPI